MFICMNGMMITMIYMNGYVLIGTVHLNSMMIIDRLVSTAFMIAYTTPSYIWDII